MDAGGGRGTEKLRASGGVFMSDGLVVRSCSPTLAGIKTGSLFPCAYASAGELLAAIRRLNRRLGGKGLRVLPLRYDAGRALIYLFRPRALARDLARADAAALLRARGYGDLEMHACVCQLAARFRAGGDFPHEVGLFLGYPPEDVWGFITNGACGHKCAGCWKVYGDPAAARETFAKYKKCTRIYCALWAQGKSIEGLAVAG